MKFECVWKIKHVRSFRIYLIDGRLTIILDSSASLVRLSYKMVRVVENAIKYSHFTARITR